MGQILTLGLLVWAPLWVDLGSQWVVPFGWEEQRVEVCLPLLVFFRDPLGFYQIELSCQLNSIFQYNL